MQLRHRPERARLRHALTGLLAAGAALAAAAAPAGAAPSLPDGRAWELVSPLLSRAVDYDYGWPLPDGDHVVLTSYNDVRGVRLAERTAGGWTQTRVDLTPPGTTVENVAGVDDVAPDFARMVVEATPEGVPTYERYQLFTWEPGDVWRLVGDGVRYAGGSEDLDTLVVVPFTGYSPYPEIRSGSKVYRWHDGAVESIGDDVRGAAVCGADVADGGELRGIDQTGVSHDGETVVLTSRACEDPVLRTPDGTAVSHARHVLVWRDGETVDISTPVAGADSDATYVGNAADGSAVFFTTAAQLEPDDDNGVADLYRYDVDSGALSRPSATATGGGAGVTSAISSDDGRGAWFATGGTLWSWTAGDGRARGIVSAGRDDFFFAPGYANGSTMTQISEDGRVLVWFTSARIGGHRGSAPQIVRATSDGELDCVSCRPDGSDADAGFSYAPSRWLVPQPRISADGEHVFFQSSTRLSPDDVNSAVDVYGWHDGVVSLISGGSAAVSSELNGVSRDGAVYFKERARLLPWVADDHIKIYTARIGGGFPAPAPETPACADDACQAPPRAPDAPPAPGSAAFDGPADADEPERPWAADPKVTLGRLSAAVKRRLAAGRAIRLPLRATARGRVSATATARIGGRWVRVGSARASLPRAGRATLPLRLSKRARATLARRGALRVRIVVVHAGAAGAARTTFVLKTTAGRGR